MNFSFTDTLTNNLRCLRDRGTVLMRYARSVDAGYGDEAAMRDRLTACPTPWAYGCKRRSGGIKRNETSR